MACSRMFSALCIGQRLHVECCVRGEQSSTFGAVWVFISCAGECAAVLFAMKTENP